MKSEKLNIEAQMDKFKHGDELAFLEIYEVTKHIVFATALNILKDYALAEDIMQDTYIKMRASVCSYQNNTNPIAWIVTIARNLSLNLYKQRKREQSTDFLDAAEERKYGKDENLETGVLLEQAFRALNQTEREIVTMHAIVGLKHREIAQIMGLPLGTVLFKYSASIKKMKECMLGEESK